MPSAERAALPQKRRARLSSSVYIYKRCQSGQDPDREPCAHCKHTPLDIPHCRPVALHAPQSSPETCVCNESECLRFNRSILRESLLAFDVSRGHLVQVGDSLLDPLLAFDVSRGHLPPARELIEIVIDRKILELLFELVSVEPTVEPEGLLGAVGVPLRPVALGRGA